MLSHNNTNDMMIHFIISHLVVFSVSRVHIDHPLGKERVVAVHWTFFPLWGFCVPLTGTCNLGIHRLFPFSIGPSQSTTVHIGTFRRWSDIIIILVITVTITIWSVSVH